jgi:hypothetical protein
MWAQATQLEQERMDHTKTLYDKILSEEKYLSDNVKALAGILGKMDTELAAAQRYSFRNFVTKEDLKGLRQLNELMGSSFDFAKSNTI